MNLSKTFAISVLSLILCFYSIVSSAYELADKKEIEEVHDKLRALKTVMEKAMNYGDIETIVANVSDDIVFTTMNDDVVRGKEAIREYFTVMMKGPDRRVESVKSSFKVDDLSIFYGSDTAIAYGSTDDKYNLADGTEFTIHARWSTTMVKIENKWKIASFHYSANIFDNPILSAQRQFMIIMALIIAIIVAFVFFFIGKRTVKSA